MTLKNQRMGCPHHEGLVRKWAQYSGPWRSCQGFNRGCEIRDCTFCLGFAERIRTRLELLTVLLTLQSDENAANGEKAKMGNRETRQGTISVE